MLNGVRTLRLRILKTSGTSVPALKSVQVFGYVAYNCDPDSARSVLQKWFDMIKDRPAPKVREETVEAPKDEPVTSEDNLEVPEEFLDSLTCEIMALPVRLPSGNVVDERTLERFTQQEAAWGRSASDPFTGQVFDVHRKPLYDTALKARIDAFLLQHNNRKCLQNVGRTVGAITKRSSELLVAKYNNGTRPVPYSVDAERTSMSTNRPPATPPSSSSPLSQAVDQSRRLLANLATAQRHISRGQPTKTAVPSLTSASSTPSTTGQTPVPTCWCGQTDGLYVLPCTHHVCRPCLLRLTNADRNQDLQCQHCRQSFSTQEPVRLHNASAKASRSSPWPRRSIDLFSSKFTVSALNSFVLCPNVWNSYWNVHFEEISARLLGQACVEFDSSSDHAGLSFFSEQ